MRSEPPFIRKKNKWVVNYMRVFEIKSQSNAFSKKTGNLYNTFKLFFPLKALHSTFKDSLLPLKCIPTRLTLFEDRKIGFVSCL